MLYEPTLLLDTCEENASIALCSAEQLVEQQILPERTASSLLMRTVHGMLDAHDVRPAALHCVGVVSGPGSFTGVRIGLAFAKGFCLAAGVPLVTVSRLKVLAQAATDTPLFAIAEAGRHAVYLRDLSAQTAACERMLSNEEAFPLLRAVPAVFASQEVADRFESSPATVRRLKAFDALGLVLARCATDADEVESADANYVRDEGAIYRRTGSSSKP